MPVVPLTLVGVLSFSVGGNSDSRLLLTAELLLTADG